MTSITCFDGVGCIGGNKILLENGGARLFFDFGRNFKAESDYYEEFLQPKNCAGLYEYIQMGLLPPIRGVYRSDMHWETADPWAGIEAVEIGEVAGVLVSHAHLDHMGALHHLRPDIPIYCSPMTAAIARALQDSGRGATAAEYCHWVERDSHPETGLSARDQKKPSTTREFRLTGEVSKGFRDLWNASPTSRRELVAGEFGSAETCAGMPVRSFPVDHSIFGASAWAVETEAGWVVYTGDLRLHGGHGELTRRFAQQVAGLRPAALIIEGTRISSDNRTTEQQVAEACLNAVKDCTGLVVADFGPRNVERLLSFRKVALETGRMLVILPGDAYLLHTMKLAEGEQAVPELDESWVRIYREYSSETSLVWRNRVWENYGHLQVRPSEVSANQDSFILCLSFFDVNELAYIRPVPGSVWIYSSCEAFDEEMAISAHRLQKWLDRFGMQRRGKLERGEEETDPFHVSGHASGPDLVELVETIRPRVLIPIHTEQPHEYAEKTRHVCPAVIPEPGVPIVL